MKFSAALVLAALPLLAAAAQPAARQQRPQRGANRGGVQKGGVKATAKAPAATVKATGKASVKVTATAKGGKVSTASGKITNPTATARVAADAAAGAAAGAAGGAAAGAAAGAAVGGAAAPAAGAAAANTGDPKTSLTLDPAVIAKGFANDGQATKVDGQVASRTSTNNFINFCKEFPQLPIMNGLQIKTGSCNPAPMGIIAANTNIPSCKFVFPPNGDTSLKAFAPFEIRMAIKHMTAGNFVNAQASYFAAPQTVDKNGDIIGHSHFVIEALTSLDQTTVTDPTKFAFFKGIDTAANGAGELTVKVAAGLPDGFYRLSSINSAANHQPALVSVAQHGSIDDAVYFTVGKGNADAAGADAAAQAAATKAAAAAAAGAAAPAAGAATGAAAGAAAGAATGAAGGKAAAGAAAQQGANNAGKAQQGQAQNGQAQQGQAQNGQNNAGKFGGFKGGRARRFAREY